MGKDTGLSKKDMLVGIPAALVFVIIGFVLVYVGFYFYNDIRETRSKGIKTEGTIVRYERRGPGTSNLRDMFAVPIVRFYTKSGQEVIVEGKVDNTSVLQNLCEAGEQVEIIYDPANPQHAIINTFAELWFAPLLAWLVGTGFILGPPFTIWRAVKQQNQSR